MESGSQSEGLGAFGWWLVAVSQALGMSMVVLTGVWMGQYHGGFSWDGSAHQFNIHPFCMVLGLFLYGDGVLVYRVFRNESKRPVKMLHALIHVMSMIIFLIGIVAVFGFHSSNKIPDMYSLHSWCGLATFIGFCIQWLMGFGFFLFPVASAWLRAWYLPLHKFFGVLMFALMTMSCLLGITEKLLFALPSTYSKFLPEGVLANCLGVLLLLFAALLGYLVTREEYRRPPNPEEEPLSVHFKTLNEEAASPRGSLTSP